MTINLEDYIKKTVEVELRNGKIKAGKVDMTYGVFYISGICRPSGQIVEYYNDGTNISLTKESPNDIIKIKEIKEPEMTINLEDYIGKTVEVELRNGRVIAGHKILVNRTNSFAYKYVLDSYIDFYNQDGMSNSGGNYDIIKIKEIKETPTEPETMSNVIRSKIDVFTTENERVEVTLDDDGLFLTACHKGAREDLSIGSKDLAISVARAIIEAYS
jgi:small nuclear ribonucleoprotein (snRNP)-like protein